MPGPVIYFTFVISVFSLTILYLTEMRLDIPSWTTYSGDAPAGWDKVLLERTRCPKYQSNKFYSSYMLENIQFGNIIWSRRAGLAKFV